VPIQIVGTAGSNTCAGWRFQVQECAKWARASLHRRGKTLDTVCPARARRLCHINPYDAQKPDVRRDGNVYRRQTYRRGRESEFDIDADEILTLAEAVEKILSEELLEIVRRSPPQQGPN
jgi:hypothetical protein